MIFLDANNFLRYFEQEDEESDLSIVKVVINYSI